MDDTTSDVDLWLLEQHFATFRSFVEAQGDQPLVSLASHAYLHAQEGYKDRVALAGRDALNAHAWDVKRIGEGEVLDSVIAAIELRENNLLDWQGRHGPDSRAHVRLLAARDDRGQLRQVEQTLFDLYRSDVDDRVFGELCAICGRRYPLMAYLFFLKDPTRFLPIAPRIFDHALAMLGSGLVTSMRCSWENYQQFLTVIGTVRDWLRVELGPQTSLLDAHSFVWTLASKLRDAPIPERIDRYLALAAPEREAIHMARIGQGPYRRGLLALWDSRCAVTDCANTSLLSASHIKPWRLCEVGEHHDPYNGFPLSPSLDACFDEGLITFSDDAEIVISPRLTKQDATAIGVRTDMRLRVIHARNRPYLDYHRARIFKAS